MTNLKDNEKSQDIHVAPSESPSNEHGAFIRDPENNHTASVNKTKKSGGRGRREKPLKIYEDQTYQTSEKLREELKKCQSKKDKKRIKNQLSAYKSRLTKRREIEDMKKKNYHIEALFAIMKTELE